MTPATERTALLLALLASVAANVLLVAYLVLRAPRMMEPRPVPCELRVGDAVVRCGG